MSAEIATRFPDDLEKMFDCQLNPFRIMAAIALDLGTSHGRKKQRRGSPLSPNELTYIQIRWGEAREAALRLAGECGLPLDRIDAEITRIDSAFLSVIRVLRAGKRSSRVEELDSASVRLYDLHLMSEAHWRQHMGWKTASENKPIPAVRFDGGANRVLVCGKGKRPRSKAAISIVVKLLAKFPESLSKDDVESGRKALMALRREDPDWEDAIAFPGRERQGGYRIRSMQEVLAIRTPKLST